MEKVQATHKTDVTSLGISVRFKTFLSIVAAVTLTCWLGGDHSV